MRVSFIGMSNIGKTYWSKRISSENRCSRIDCDLLIEKKLTHELIKGGYKGLRGVAKWMGFPSDSQYLINSQHYIEAEKSVMLSVLEQLNAAPGQPIILDTTGSVIYTGKDIIKKIRDMTKIIYFEASEAHISNLYNRYISNPKPVIWGNNYNRHEPETVQDALKRCYPELLRHRMQQYKAIAHITVPFEYHKDRTRDLGTWIRQQIGLV